MDKAFYSFWLSYAYKIPTAKLWDCIQGTGSPKAFYEAKPEELKGLTMRECRILRQLKEQETILQAWETLEQKSYQFLPYDHPEYPNALLELQDVPFGIYYEGTLPNANQPMVAMVGSRQGSIYGREYAYQMARELSGYGIGVVSGLAAGIDGASHRGSLDGNGYTLGILGCGIEYVYPKENYQLYCEMKKRGGILSEYPPDTAPFPMLFPRRNRMISILADFVLVVEARERSGSLITADLALEQGKEVGAVPGRPCDSLYMGCNQLIQQGAKCILDAEDVLEEILGSGIRTKQGAAKELVNPDLGLAPKEKMVYSCVRLEPEFIDSIISRLPLPVWEGIQLLTELEKKGMIRQNPHQYYYRIR